VKFFVKESTTVGLWHFEETSGSTQNDSSGNVYHLTDNANAPTRITTADFGGGLDFNGTTQFTERNGGGANLESSSVTVEVLVKTPSPTASVGVLIAYSPRGQAVDGRGWYMGVGAILFAFSIGHGTGTYTTVSSTVTLPLSRWIYCAGTYDGTNLRVYQCGTLVGGPTAAAAINYTDSPSAGAGTYRTVSFGEIQDNNGNPTLFGKYQVSDVRVSNIAKSDSDIYNEQLTQQYCETQPKSTGITNFGAGQQMPFGSYQRYKSVRAAVAQYNNLVVGP
jgi:hypothetical protein